MSNSPQDLKCITFIGMAGSGKTTLGKALAKHINWAHIDTDLLIEAWWGLPLQEIYNFLSTNNFLQMESEAILQLDVKRTIISPGGSVVYLEKAMENLKSKGPVIYLATPANVILERIENPTSRGIVMKDGLTLADLCEERRPLYEKYADYTLFTNEDDIQTCIDKILKWHNIKN